MPKAFSEQERKIVKEAMLARASFLLRQKGIRQVTVEDITKGANIAKGSFYSFYKKREELFWELIKKEEKQLLNKIHQVALENIPLKEKFQKIFHDLFLAEDCIVFYLSQDDLQYMMRKLPPQLLDEDRQSSENVIKNLLAMCGLRESSESISMIMSMIHTLQFVASDNRVGDKTTRKNMLSLLIEAFSEYYAKNLS